MSEDDQVGSELRAETIKERLKHDMFNTLRNTRASEVLSIQDQQQVIDLLALDAMFQIEILLEEE